MPTEMRRIQVALPPKVDAALARLQRITGKPQATVVRELLDDFAPHIVALADALEVARKQPQEALDRVAEMLKDATALASQAELDIAELRKRKPGRKPRKRGTG